MALNLMPALERRDWRVVLVDARISMVVGRRSRLEEVLIKCESSGVFSTLFAF